MSEHVDVPPRRTGRALALMLVSLVVYTALDLGTKEWALEHLSEQRSGEQPAVCEADQNGRLAPQRLANEGRPLVEGVLNLRYAENCGAAFSMLHTAPGWVRLLVFGVANIGAVIALTLMFVRGAGGGMFAAAVPLIMSGAIGNLSDRLRHGFVVDFIQVDPALFRYPVFNVADIAIAVGVGLILLDGLKKPPATPARAEPASAR